MEQRLYRVKVILYVMAENESEACVAATNARFDIFECSAKKATKLDPGWDEAIPYNAGDARTCAEIISSVQKVVQPAATSQPYIERWQPRVQTYTNSAAVQASPR